MDLQLATVTMEGVPDHGREDAEMAVRAALAARAAYVPATPFSGVTMLFEGCEVTLRPLFMDYAALAPDTTVWVPCAGCWNVRVMWDEDTDEMLVTVTGL